MLAIAEQAVASRHQTIALVIEPNRAHVAEWLVLDVAEPTIDLEVFQEAKHFRRRAGLNAEAHVRMPRPERRRQLRHHAKHRRDRSDLQLAGQFLLEALDLLPHGARIADDAARPVQRPLAFRRESLEARTA